MKDREDKILTAILGAMFYGLPVALAVVCVFWWWLA